METKYMTEADKYMELALTELSKSNWWFNRIDTNKAINLLKSAGVSYALIPDFTKSAFAYLMALQLIMTSDYENKHDIALSYLGACNEGWYTSIPKNI
jgi:hypothetical protein